MTKIAKKGKFAIVTGKNQFSQKFIHYHHINQLRQQETIFCQQAIPSMIFIAFSPV